MSREADEIGFGPSGDEEQILVDQLLAVIVYFAATVFEIEEVLHDRVDPREGVLVLGKIRVGGQRNMNLDQSGLHIVKDETLRASTRVS